MIWMGVAGPKDFVAIGNRFPTHYQWVTMRLEQLFVANLLQVLMVQQSPHAGSFRIMHQLASGRIRQRGAPTGNL
jgi:hypothetical protein